MRQWRFCSKDELDTDVGLASKHLHSSRFCGCILLLRLLLCTTFNGEQVWIGERFQKICFRQVLVGSRSSWKTHFRVWGQNFEKSKIRWKVTSPGSKWAPKIQNRFADAKSGSQIDTWLVEKVPRRVIGLAPRENFDQRWAEHRCTIGIEKLRLLAIQPIVLRFEASALYNF